MMKKLCFIPLWLLLSVNTMAQTKLGSEIIGNSSGDSLGYSVSLSDNGLRMAVGAPANDAGGTGAGQVLILEESAGNWTLLQTLNGASTGDGFGYDVAMDTMGSRMIIGAPFSSTNTGYVQVWEETGGIWSQVHTNISGTSTGEYFGWAVDMSTNGNFIAISAPERNTRGTGFRYEDNGSSWSQLNVIESPTSGNWPTNVRHGHDIAISGNGERILIGAPNSYPTLSPTSSGAARLFGLNASSVYARLVTFRGTLMNDFAGTSVSLSYDGKVAALGAIGDGGTFDVRTGRILLFEQTGSLTDANSGWAIQSALDGVGVNAQFGISVSLSEDGMVLGAGANNFGYGEVRAYVYNTGTSTWDVQSDLLVNGTNSTPFLGPYFGQSVSITGNADNIRFAIGAPAGVNGGLTIEQPEGGAVVYQSVSTPLPVEWLGIETKQVKDQVQLSWKTATEKNNSGFEIERSWNGSDWEKLAFINGHGTTNEPQQYQYLDLMPGFGVNYYRLKQIDWDGQFEYSEITHLNVQSIASGMVIYPNPVINKQLILYSARGAQQAIKLSLLDLTGRMVMQEQVEWSLNASNWTLKLPSTCKGYYILKLESGNEQWMERLLVK